MVDLWAHAIEFALVVLIGLSAVTAWILTHDRPRKRALRDAGCVSVTDYPDGGVKRIVGELSLLDEALTAPLSGRRCAAYEIVIEAPGQYSTHRVAHEIRSVPFVVRDETGQAVVRPEHAGVLITSDVRSTSSWSDDPTPEEEALLRRLASSYIGQTINSRLVYREGVLEPGEQVAVLGHGIRSCDDEVSETVTHDGGYRIPAGPTVLTIVGSPANPAFISDDPSALTTPKRLPKPADVRP
ncbi:MAG: GIDE domain-containing protein [Nannocystaceae bacterium]